MNRYRNSGSATLLLILLTTFISFPFLKNPVSDNVISGIPAYPDDPLPGHSGGFGEPNCQACHFDMPLNDPAGTVEIKGIPEKYESGKAYQLEIHIEHPEMNRAGFQFTARFPDGEDKPGLQAGDIEADSSDSMVTMHEDILYVHHTESGTIINSPHTKLWEITWSAPEIPSGPVVFNVAANAANGDDSEFGDFIYLQEGISNPD
ncbi:MAG: choice-of-anchor V domain-containing protein [Balneolales bacterium]